MPESEPGLIRRYLDTLAARLPASVTDELATATGVAGCLGYAAIDLALIIGAVFLLAPVGWVTAAAMAASTARIAVTAQLLRPALAR